MIYVAHDYFLSLFKHWFLRYAEINGAQLIVVAFSSMFAISMSLIIYYCCMKSSILGFLLLGKAKKVK